MQIAGLQKLSTVDYPGMLSAVVFTAGCNCNCWFCHNADLLHTETDIPSDEVIHFLQSRIGRLDGVVLSGGEPTIHEDLPAFLEALRETGYRIKRDTNGSRPEVVDAVLEAELVDYVAVDLKAPPNMYKSIGGGTASEVRATINLLRAYGTSFEVRTTVIPGLGKSALREMCQFAGAVPLYALQLYRARPGSPAPEHVLSDLEDLRAALLDIQPRVVVRG